MRELTHDYVKEIDLKALAHESGVELPCEIPDAHIGLTISDGRIHFRVEYSEEQIIDITQCIEDLEKGDIEYLGLQILMAIKKLEKQYKNELDALKGKVL